jgi:hypothetical protein
VPSAQSSQALPASLKQALADPFAWGNHPDVPWRLPETLPPAADIRRGVEILEGQLRPVDRKHAAYCLSKLLVGFNERKTADESKLLLEVWLETNGDLPNDLWSTATVELLRSWQRDKHYGRIPEASDLRACAEREICDRKTRLRRAQEMLEVVTEKPKAATFVREPEDVRLRTMRDSLKRIGKLPRAAVYERELAVLEGREPETWVFQHHAEQPQAVQETTTSAPPLPQSAGTKAAMLRARAEFWGTQPGAEAMAARLTGQAEDASTAIAHPDEPVAAAA